MNSKFLKGFLALVFILSLLVVGVTASKFFIAQQNKDDDPTQQDKPPIQDDDPTTQQPDDNPDDDIIKPTYISEAQAIQIALNRLGADAILLEIEADLDDNPPKYELEMTQGNYEYELEIHAITGSIIDFEKDEND